MSNTSRPLPEHAEALQQRLDQLAAFDPASAEFIRMAGPEKPLPLQPPQEPLEVQWNKGSDGASSPDMVILLGAGDPADIARVFSHYPETTHFFLMETLPAAAARLFRNFPLEEHIQEGRLTLALGTEENTLTQRFLSLVNLQRAPAIQILELCSVPPADARLYYDALKQAQKTVHLNVFNLGTLVYRGPLWQYNTIVNLPLLATHPGVSRLSGLFRSRPAVVVGAGPSLDHALEALKAVRGNCVLISTGTALRTLRREGIRPDIVLSVDASHRTGPQFETDCGDLFLACSSLAYPPLLPKFRGIFSASMASNPISEWLNTLGESKGTLVAAGTVTTSAVDLARQMGCNPIVCLGTDLSFADDGTTHVRHSMYHGSRLDPARLIRVPGNYQESVLTSEQFKCYIDLLEDYIRAHGETRFINATTAGARITGMELAGPDILREIAARPFDAYGRIAQRHADFTAGSLPELCAELRATIGQLREIMSQARSAAMLCNQLIMMFSRPHPGDEAVARTYLETLQDIDRQLTGRRTCSIFLDMSLWPIGYQSGTRREQHEERYSEALLAHRRSRSLYEQIAGAAKWTGELLGQIVKKMEPFEPLTEKTTGAACHELAAV